MGQTKPVCEPKSACWPPICAFSLFCKSDITHISKYVYVELLCIFMLYMYLLIYDMYYI